MVVMVKIMAMMVIMMLVMVAMMMKVEMMVMMVVVQVVESAPDPRVTLLTYLREVLGLCVFLPAGKEGG